MVNDEETSKWKTLLAVMSTILIILCLIVGVGLGLAAFGMKALSPTEPSSEQIQFMIESGTNITGIASILKENGLIRDKKLFTYYLRFKDEGSRFQAGLYEMQPGITLDEIIVKLNNGDTVEEEMVRFTIPEGYTLMQMADKLSEEKLIDRAVFISLLENHEQFDSSWIQHIPDVPEIMHQLEGYLFPETYEMKKVSQEEDIILRMLEELDRKLGQLPVGWESELEKAAISFHEMMTIASLIEREVIVNEERAIVSGVIYNRLEINMPLQIDATVQYALDTHKEHLLNDDLKVDSPYNTYEKIGLPPGPIASPSLSSIKAAIYPNETPYYYYVTKKDGSNTHYFAETYERHLSNKRKSEKE